MSDQNTVAADLVPGGTGLLVQIVRSDHHYEMRLSLPEIAALGSLTRALAQRLSDIFAESDNHTSQILALARIIESASTKTSG